MTGIDIAFVDFPVDQTVKVDKILAGLPCRPVKFVAFPFDQEQRGALFVRSLCKYLIDVSQQE
jgi:hypothetical protein